MPIEAAINNDFANAALSFIGRDVQRGSHVSQAALCQRRVKGSGAEQHHSDLVLDSPAHMECGGSTPLWMAASAATFLKMASRGSR